jgi:hypothetical protein
MLGWKHSRFVTLQNTNEGGHKSIRESIRTSDLCTVLLWSTIDLDTNAVQKAMVVMSDDNLMQCFLIPKPPAEHSLRNTDVEKWAEW